MKKLLEILTRHIVEHRLIANRFQEGGNLLCRKVQQWVDHYFFHLYYTALMNLKSQDYSLSK